MNSKKRKANKTKWLGLWLFLVCAMLSSACSKSVIGSYSGGASYAAPQAPKAATQYAAPKTLQSSASAQVAQVSKSARPAQAPSARVGEAVRKHSSLPVLTASSQPAAKTVARPAAKSAAQPAKSSVKTAVKPAAKQQATSKQAALKPAKQSTQAASKQVSRGKATAVRGDAVCRTVRGQMGMRYKYGGASPKTGFDCSGLLVWAYKQHGVSIPRTAKAQAGAGKSVQRNKLAPGDIVVFKIKSGYHTGLYSGNNKFIHSPRTGSTVREDKLDNSYWKKAYIGARRVI